MNPEPIKFKKSQGIYLLPNLFTTAALFAGFYAVVAAMKSHFEIAAIAVFVAMVLDALDGRVARLTNTQSAFGAEYDSLSDMVSFGVAPALVAYSWSLSQLGKLGWLVAFVYAAATALRLARFNTQAHDQDKRYFQGLPSPAAAGVVSSMVWLGDAYQTTGMLVAIFSVVVTLFAAVLMVSRIRYNSFKQIDWKGKVPFVRIVVVVLLLAAIAIDPAEMLFAIFFSYAISGPVMTLLQIRKMRRYKETHRK